MIASGKEAVEELEKEIRKERKKRKYELLRSLTDTLPTVGGGGEGTEMDEDGPAGGLSSGDNAAEELGDFA